MFVAKTTQTKSEHFRANVPTLFCRIFLKIDHKASFKCQCVLGRQNAYRRK